MASASTLEELPRDSRALLDEVYVGHLGAIDDHGAPRVLPVTFAVADGRVWSAVDSKPKRRPGEDLARVRWLRERPRAAITVDRYDHDWSRLAWVQLLGDVAVLDAGGQDAALAALTERYPAYRAQPPPGPLLCLEVDRALWWSAAGAP